jgi:hypothetical protein
MCCDLLYLLTGQRLLLNDFYCAVEVVVLSLHDFRLPILRTVEPSPGGSPSSAQIYDKMAIQYRHGSSYLFWHAVKID